MSFIGPNIPPPPCDGHHRRHPPKRFGVGAILVVTLMLVVAAWLAVLSLRGEVGSLLSLSEIAP